MAVSSEVPKLKDIARKAKVSMSTASVILRNGNGRFNSKTRERVVSVARELGWRQNLLVQGIQTGKTRMIGVLVPPYDSYWSNILSGIQNELASADYIPITLWIGDHSENIDRFKKDDKGLCLIHRLLDRRVDGLILWPPIAVTYTKHFVELVERKLPVVVVDHELTEQKIADSVETDEELGGKLVAEHLTGLGHKNIACLTEVEFPNRPWAARRRDAFGLHLKKHPDVKFKFWRLGRGNNDGRQVAREMLQSNFKPTAVFCVTDHEAKDVYDAAADIGLEIPKDISVVGFSDLSFAKTMHPALTTIVQKPVEVGWHAARLILERVRGNMVGTGPHTIKIACELVVRESTAPCKST